MGTWLFRTLLGLALITLPMTALASGEGCGTKKFYHLGCPKKKAPPQPAAPVHGGLAKTTSATNEPTNADPAAPATEVVFHVGNESNQNDGVRGPFTYGLEATHAFRNGVSLEGAYTRLHERGMPKSAFYVDEAQLSLKSPEARVLGQPLVFGATAWKNRMMDMYTNLGGLEVTRSGKIAVNAGVYGGHATLDELRGRFIGAQLGASGSIGPVELAIAHMSGAIRTPGDASRVGEGRYRKSGIEAATNVHFIGTLPLTVTGSLEKRYFSFGNGGPVADPTDTYIFVTGVEANAGDLLHVVKGALGRGAR
jgi:hypothetical protein